MKAQIYNTNSKTGKISYRFRLFADNGEQIAQGQAYVLKQSCIDTVQLIGGTSIPIEDISTK